MGKFGWDLPPGVTSGMIDDLFYDPYETLYDLLVAEIDKRDIQPDEAEAVVKEAFKIFDFRKKHNMKIV